MKQEQDIGTTSDQQAQKQPVKPTKPAKNLYEPYVTPPIAYETLRWILIFIIHAVCRLHLRGRYNLPAKGPYIIAANHLAWADIPLVPLHIHGRKVVFMAKEEYFRSKIAWLLRFFGAFPVKRGEADRQALRTGEEQLKKGNILVIFPEGTRSRTRTLAKAHPGMAMIALRTGVPIVPVAVWGSEKVLKTFRPSVTISYGEPMILKPKGQKITREDLDEATAKVMHKIAEMLPPEYRGVYSADIRTE